MAEGFEVKKKTENFEAQYREVKNKLNQVTQEVNDVIELKEGYLLEIQNLEGELSTKRKELLGLRRELKDAEEHKEQAEHRLSEAKKNKDTVESEHEESLAALRSAAEEVENRKKRLEKELNTLERQSDAAYKLYDKRIRQREETLQQYNSKIAELKTKQDEETKELKRIENEAHKAREYISEQYDALDHRIYELEDREKEVEALARDYTEREKALKTREMNVEIVVRRLKRKYAELYNGRDITI